MARYATRLNIGYKRICSILNEIVEDEQITLNSAREAWVTGKDNSFLFPTTDVLLNYHRYSKITPLFLD